MSSISTIINKITPDEALELHSFLNRAEGSVFGNNWHKLLPDYAHLKSKPEILKFILSSETEITRVEASYQAWESDRLMTRHDRGTAKILANRLKHGVPTDLSHYSDAVKQLVKELQTA